MKYYSFTDKGKIRDTNQDSLVCAHNKKTDFLAVVSDGIGGHKAGDIASLKIINYLAKEFSANEGFEDDYAVFNFIKSSMAKINQIIYLLAQNNQDYQGMGATVTGLIFTKMGIYWLNVGDSRTYAFKKHQLKQLTTDHTLVNELLKSKLITADEALVHPKRHHITKAIGIWEQVDIDYGKLEEVAEYYLVCSDGLYGYIDDLKIASIIDSNKIDTLEKAKTLMNTALDNGGGDNISIILIKTDEVEDE